MIVRLLLLAAICIALAQTGAGLYSSTSKVVQVDATNFDSTVLKSKVPVLVEFYAPWCGHCKNLAPTYEKVAKSLSSIAKVVAVDADNEKNRILAQRYGISGFPTIKLFKNGAPNEYQGAREKKPMVEFVKQNLPSKVKRITSANLDGFLSKQDIPRALLFMPNDEVNAYFKSLSTSLVGRMVFGQISAKSSQDLFNKYSITDKSDIVIFPAKSSEPIKFGKKLRKNKAKAQAFILEHALPRDPSELKLPQLYDQSCLKAHCLDANSALCAIGITAGSSDFNKLEALSEVSEATESRMCTFSWVEEPNNENFTSAFGIDSPGQMKLVFFSPRKSRFALFTGDFTKQDISKFLDNIIKGKVSTLPMRSTPSLNSSTSKCSKQKKEKSTAQSDRDEL